MATFRVVDEDGDYYETEGDPCDALTEAILRADDAEDERDRLRAELEQLRAVDAAFGPARKLAAEMDARLEQQRHAHVEALGIEACEQRTRAEKAEAEVAQMRKTLDRERQWRDEARAQRDAANAELTQLRDGLDGYRIGSDAIPGEELGDDATNYVHVTHEPCRTLIFGDENDPANLDAAHLLSLIAAHHCDASDTTPAMAGTGATHTASGTEGGASVELEFAKPAAGQTEADGDRDQSAWCWAPNPDGPLHCGRLARHPGKHKRGEREWD